MIELESSLGPVDIAAPALRLGATVPNQAKPGEKPEPKAGDLIPGSSLRLFVVQAPEDAWFVEGFLLEALRLPEHEVLVSSKLEPGAMIVREIERGALSPVTVVVVSPAFLASPWAQFAHQLAMHQSIEAANDGSATLVPAILADCELPLLSRFRVPLDFRSHDRAHWEAEAERLRKKLAAPAPVAVPVPCPYPGIRPFTMEDAARFHGRDSEVRELLGRLRAGQRELYVIGPSGSGKSSLVAAGLVPSLRRSPELAGGSFLIRQMRPGAAPTTALAGVLEATPEEQGDSAMLWLDEAVGRLLANHPSHDRLLIIVDQLEELFTTAESHACAAFIATIRVLRRDSRVALVLTLRADFYASLMESALWADLDGQLSRLDVSPLRGDKLRKAIEAPARALGIYFEPVLVKQLLHDVADEPGALPLLQDTLLELWHQRTRCLLRLAEYEAMSDGVHTGLAVTVARRANGALNDLSPGQREIARRMLLRLVQFRDGTAATRRQQPRAALSNVGDTPEEIDAVVRHLTDHRLVTTSGGPDVAPSARVDLAHEVLLSAWPALGEWIRSRKEDEQRRRVLEAKAAEWVKSGRGRSRLLDDEELREVHGWLTDAKARDLGVSEDIQRLLAFSEDNRRRRRRWRTVAITGLLGTVVAVSMLAVIAERRSREASEKASEVKRQLARHYVSQGNELLMSGHPAQAVPYLLAAREAGAEDLPLHMLFRWADQRLPLLKLTHRGLVTAVAWSPIGMRVATASNDGTARIWDAGSGQPVTPPLAHWLVVRAVAWSPDGTRIATASADHTARVWDASSGQAVTPPFVHSDGVLAVAWSPDGMRVATVSADQTARVWDVSSGRAVAAPLSHQGRIRAVAWSPDGRRVATASADHTARVWDADSGQPVTPPLTHQGDVHAVAWSPDGRRVATASWDQTARVWDAVSGQAVTPPLAHQNGVNVVAWSPDGKRVATASSDGAARIWDVGSGEVMTSPLTHQGSVSAVAWSPDGTRVATASEDHTARVWDVSSGQAVMPPLAHQGKVNAVAWSPDGRRMATASEDGTVRVWDLDSRHTPTPPLAHQGRVLAVAWSPDGKHVATASTEKTARVWDASSGQAVTPPLTHQGQVLAVVWSPGGQWVATASADHTARVWNASSGQAVAPPFTHQGGIMAMAWSPDGRRVATGSVDHTARVWDAVTGQAVTPPLAHMGAVLAVAWNPDGRRVATASEDESARVWDAITGQAVTPPLAHQGGVTAVAWSSDGKRVATASLDHTARVWDAVTGQQVMPPLVHQGGVLAVAWSPDGNRIATASDDGTALVWNAVSGQAITPPFVHQGRVLAVAWSPDSQRVVTASADGTARIWDMSWDMGTLADWRATLERCDYRLNDEGILVARDPQNSPSSLP